MSHNTEHKSSNNLSSDIEKNLKSLLNLRRMAEPIVTNYQRTSNIDINEFAELYYINEIICNCFIDIKKSLPSSLSINDALTTVFKDVDSEFIGALRATLSHVGHEQGIDVTKTYVSKNFNLANFYKLNSDALIETYKNSFKPIIDEVEIIMGEPLLNQEYKNRIKAFSDVRQEEIYLPEAEPYKQYLFIAYKYLVKLQALDQILKNSEQIAKYSLYMHFFVQALGDVSSSLSIKDKKVEEWIKDFKGRYKLIEQRNMLAHTKEFPTKLVNLVKNNQKLFQELEDVCKNLSVDLNFQALQAEKNKSGNKEERFVENKSEDKLSANKHDSSKQKKLNKKQTDNPNELTDKEFNKIIEEHSGLVDFSLYKTKQQSPKNKVNQKKGFKLKTDSLNQVFSNVIKLGSENDAIRFFNKVDKNKIDINKEVKYGFSIFSYAIQKGWINLVTKLINFGAILNQDNQLNISPLIIASQNGHKEIVRLLLEKAAVVDITDIQGVTPLYIASQNGHIDIVKLLLEKGATAHSLCIIDNTTPLFMAAYMGHTKVVELLSKNNSEIDYKDNVNRSSLFMAAYMGHIDIVKLLLQAGAKVNLLCTNDEITPLYVAAQEGYVEVVKLLLEHKANVNTPAIDKITPLSIAAGRGHYEVVELLINYGANVDIPSDYGITPLYIAAQEGHLKVVEVLIKNGANVEYCSDEGFTPLFMAAQYGNHKVIEILLKKENNVNLTYMETKLTALIMAVRGEHLEAVKILIKYGAKIETSSTVGMTPLLLAAYKGNYEIVELLLKSGAKVDNSSNAGSTPLSIATERGHAKVMKLLQNYKSLEKSNVVGLYEKKDNIDTATPGDTSSTEIDNIENHYESELALTGLNINLT